MSIPEWFRQDAERAVDQWQHDGRWYIVQQIPRSVHGVEWILANMRLNGLGGGSAPFATKDALDAYVQRCQLREPEQMTLGI